MEKPKFAFSAVTAKVQFKLCEEEPVYAIPASINQYLRDYQRDGVKFLYENYTQKTGAILGDDMGLGKTVQVIAFLSALLRKQGNREDVMRLKPKFIRELSDTERLDDPAIRKPFLIIGPGSVLYNWLDELETWGYFTARKYHGSDKFQTLAEAKKEKIEIVVTTYETFRDNVDELNSVKWCAVIVDEVHRIKGLTSQTTAALRKIHTPCRFGLTGTALQNNVTELWSILDWARPGFLGNLKSFETEFVRRIERGQKHDATKRELAEARKMKEKFANLRNKMMLRRTKKLIADQLPEKDDNIVFSKLTTLQVDVYKAILNHPDMRLILSMEDPCQCGSQKPQVKCCRQTSSDGTPVRNLMFTYMSLLMKTANHVALLIPNKTTSEGQRKHAKEICEIAFAKHPQFVSQASEASFRTLSDPKYCGKMKILKGLLSVFRKKHNKILLFSYSTKLLSIVEQYVISVGYEYRRIDGSVSSKKRMDIVREFNNDKNIFICLISTKAGGLGLNLTGANVVIIFDPNWNPSYDLQAQDRAYRIGQRRNVQVFRLVSAGTIEENIYLRQVYKQQLDTVAVEMGNAKRYFHGIQGDKHNKGELFGLKNMFKLQTGEHCLTMDILKRNENLEAGLKNFDIVEYLPCSNESQESDSAGITDGAGGQSSEDSSDEFGGLMDMFLDQQSREDGDQEEGTGRSREKTVANVHARTHKSSRVDENSVSEDASAGTLRGDNSIVREPPSSTSKPGPQPKLNKSKGKGPGKRKTVQFVDKGESLPGSFGSVAEVLDHCGVLHVHKNPQMIGSSRAEDHMSRCAIQDVFELHVNSQIPAIQCPPLSQPSDSEESDTVVKKPAKVSKSHGPSYNQSCARSIGSTRILIGQTPKAIKREQFEKLAAFMNCGSQTDFAEQVLSMSVTQRVELLNSFYHTQQQELFPLFTVAPVPEQTPPRSRLVKEKGILC
ncbi:DNA excision repair protein ERCC-6-like 2 [Liolophura sinensis]|uniref:DNA excision repair protein ERCC-6-like 2 n=1 Tax=Liolophura sinensis TaxID=3198878 RepID=UPI0031585533